ncbi:carbohydrate binding domain-containing protein [Klebsiella pneumoniae]|nr:carbohydrate binding domain-containing protein [Klebsiella pneumoniae]
MANNIIKGRKGGGSKQRTPTEQPDDLQSVAKAKILLALGEGEFAGGLTGKYIYLDGTPLENADGSQNFSGVSWEFRPGTQAQTYIQGIPGTENEISVGTEVSSKTAWTHTFTNTQLSAVRVRLKWPSLMKQEDDGDVVGNTVKYAIDLQTDGGAWQTVLETAVTGKTTSGYERSHRIDLPQAGSTWTLRLRKISPDANSVKVGDVMTLQSYTEVIDAKLRYPNTALLYIEFDSSQFNGSIPQISCEPRGRVIRVPDNYNPETREYTGVWTGGFKWAWTDNPAWIYYDIVTADRFGLGNRLSSANISKWTLYQIAQYCDQLVPDGRGGDGMEPRYTCNVYVQERNDAYTVLRDFAAIFRGMTCWNGEQIVVQADMPRDVDFTYTRANIVGKPRYSSSSSQVRYTNALISWSDPDNAYADAMEPAFIPELVSRYSFNQLEMTAIGCTRQSEAHRKGLWGILTNNKDRVVEFDVGLDGRIPQPGYIIALADELLAGRVNGGRISAVNGRVITLDRDVDAKPGDRLQLNLPSGISQSRTIQAVNGRRQITVTTAYSETPERECVWAIESDDLFLQQYRVTGVKENSDATLTITGVAHDPDKFARIDTGAIIDQRPVSVLPAGNQSPPEDIVITSRSVVNQGISVETMQVNWSAVSGAIAYEAQWRRNDGNWINVPRSSTTSFEVSGIYAGRYLVRVCAINAAEISSGWAYSEEKTLTGKVGEPLPPLALTTVSLTAGIEIRWEFPAGAEDTQRTELQYSPNQNGNGALPLTDLAYPGKKYQQMGLQIATQFWYRARLVDRLGNASSWTDWVQGMSSDNVSDYFQQLDEAIKDTETYQSLVKEIDTRAVAEEVDSAIEAAKKDVASQVTDAKQEAQQLVQETRNDIEQALADEALARASAIAQESADRTAAIARESAELSDAIARESADRANAIAQESAELSDAIAREAADRAYALADEARARATAISDAVKDEAAARSKAIADEAQKRNDAIAAENAARVKAVSELDTRTADALANETAERISAVSSEAKARADALLNEENNREAAIRSLNSQLQTATESLAQQISQVAAGTGEQFDPLNIWYFDTSNEGWTEDDNGYTPMIVTDDGWLKADNGTSSARSPNDLGIDAAAYRFIKLRLKKVGNPAWNGRLLWIGADESGWDNARSVVIDEPEYDVNDTATVTLHDIPWLPSQRIRRFRLDLAQGQNEENYFLIDWLAVGRPTPGAGMAALQNEQLARTQADAAEAANRQDLAVQLRGSYDGNDLTKVSSGLIYQEQQARVTGDKAEASARQSLETRINDSLSTINQSLDTLNTADEAMASDITGLKSSLAGKADASALTTLKTQVTTQGDTLASQGASLTNLQNSLNRLSSDVSKKADAAAVQSLQNQVTQQGKDITAANSSITNLKTSLDTTDSNVAKKADATTVSDLTSRVTSAEGKVSSQGNSITRLNNSLNNVIADSDAASAIPGNLIVNPSFERGTDGYIGVSAQSTVVAVQAPRTGTRALKVDPGSVAPGQTIDFVKGRTYEVGVWVKQIAGTTDNGAGNNKLRIGNSAGNPVLEVPYTGAGTDWTKYSKRWKATETARLPVTLNNYLTAGNRYFDDFYVIDVTDSVNIDANASAIASVQNTVTQQGKDITSQSSSITDLKNSLKTTDANVAKKADAAAVQTLQNTVEQQGRDISTASSDISGLKNSLSTTDANVAKKADASALGALQSTVTQQGKDITSAGNSITQLQNSLASTNSAVNKKADAQALSALTGRVSDAEGKLSSQSDQLSTLENSLRLGSLISNGSLDNDATFWADSGSGSAFVYEAAEKALRTTTGSIRIANTTRIPVEVGMTLTLSFEFKTTETISAISSDSVGFITDLNDQTNWLVSQASWLTAVTTEWQRQTLTFTIPDKFTGQYVYLRFAAGGWSPSNSARLYLKDIEVYSSTGIAGKADASAVSELSSRVETAEGSITSQGNSLTNLQNSLNTTNANVSKKADASALQSLQNTVTQQGKTLSSASSDLSSLKNRLDTTDGNVAKKADATALQELKSTVENQGRALNSQSSQLVTLNNSLSATRNDLSKLAADVDTAGKTPGNLLSNASFERGTEGWSNDGNNWQVYAAQGPHTGKNIIRMITAGDAMLTQSFVVKGGRTYRVGVWVRRNAAVVIANAGNTKISLRDANNVEVKNVLLTLENMGNAWADVSLEYRAPADATMQISLRASLSAGEVYMDDAYVVDITDAVNIDAAAAATTALENRVSKNESAITSQSTSLTNLQNSLNTTNSNVSKKADATALTTLQNTVKQQGDSLSTQSGTLTKLQNSLTTTQSDLDAAKATLAKKADTAALSSLQNTVLQQGNTLTSQASQLTRLNNSLTTTQSGLDAVKADVDASAPGNLLVNSTFERGQDGWNGWTSQASVVELQQPRSGKMALRLAPASGTAALQQNISVLGGHTYELSAWTKVAAGTTMAPGSAANNKLRIGNTDGSAVADKQLDPATISTTTWQQTTLRYKPATDRTITVGLMYYLSAGIQYYDDVTFTDITDRIDIDANANATSNLDSRVTAAEGKVTSQGNSLVSLRNDLTAVQSDITKKADASALQNLQNTVSQQGDALSSQSDLVTMLENSLSEGSLIGNGSLKTDASLWEDSGTGSGFTWDASEKAIRTTTGSVRVANITRIPVEAGVSLTVTFEFKMSEAITAYSSDTVGFIASLRDPVNWLTSQSPWLDGVTTQWQSRTVTLDIPATFTGRYVYLRFAAGGWSPANSARLYLRNIDVTSATGVANKADASAVSSLSGRVDTVEGKVTSQASDLTNLRNSLNTTNNNVSKKADTAALQSLQNKVEQQGNDISSAGSQITELNAAILAAKAAGDDYIPNPSLDPAYNRMGYTVQASDADGIPAGCPFAYVIRLASRDHIPGINNIAVTPGDVFEMSALVACGAGSADFNFYIGRATTVTGGVKARSSGGNTKATAAWTRVTWRFTVPSDTNLMRPFLQVNQSSPFGTIWYVTDWHLRNVTAANKAQNTADNTASAVESLTTKVTQQGDTLSSIGSRTTTLENGLKTTNTSVSKKADADTVQTLQNTVTQQGKDITAANSAITKLTGDLSTTNANVNRKADATALSTLQNTVTDQGQKLASQGSSLTQLANTLSDAMTSLAADGKIPGNMISNGSFERGQDAFTGWNNVTSVIDAQSPNFGSRILMCAAGLAGITQKVPVVKGNTYKIGVFARAQAGSVMQDGNNNKLRIGGTSLLYDRKFDTANLPTGSSWVELTGTWKATVDGMVDVSIYSSLKSGAQYFDDFYLVDVTDEVNISANAGAISGLTTRVTNAEGKVTSQGNSITSLQNSLNTTNSNVSKKADAEALQNLKNTVTQQGKDISTQSSNITSLQNGLNTANAGIDSLVADNDASKRFVGNLLANPSFERGLTGYSGGGAFITVIDAQSPNTGSRILSCGTGTGAVSQSVDVTKDRTYKIGVFTRCQAGSVLDAQGNNKLRIGSSSLLYELKFRPASSSWVELTGTWKATITGKVDVSINSSLKSGNQYFDDFYFIDITDRVDLDATSNAVSSLTSRVTNAEGTISSHTGSITNLNNSLSSLNKTVSGKADTSTVQALQNTVTQQGKDLDANASSLTSINASLSTLQSQGLNPWVDGSFESYAAGKSLYGDTAIVTTDVSRNGSKSLKITRKAGETGNSDKMLGKWLSVRGGGKYRFSLWAYMDSDMSAPNAWSAIVGLYARGENGGANQWPGAVTINETNITRGKWTFLTGVASVAADRSIAQMWISTRGPSGGAGFSLYLDDINIVDVTDAQAAQTDASAAANAVTQLTATVSQQGRDITAQAKQFTELQSSLNSTDARIARQDETIAANGLAMANGFNQMRSMIGDNSAAITTTNKTVTDLEKSTTESMTQLTSQVGDMSASVQQTASTVADLNGKLSAQWGVKVGTSSGGKHYVSGLQLGMDGSGQSQFLVQADTFGVYVPNGDKSNLVFGVDGNGAYMQQAMARNLTINFGQISDSLQSTDYQPGSTGWRLPKSGAFEMNGNVPGEGRVQLDSSGLAVYDQNGVLRCKIGRI